MDEHIYDVYWEGPFDWEHRNRYLKRSHVLYAIFGISYPYGQNALLYLGKSDGDIVQRLADHNAWWVPDEYDACTVRVATVGEFISWKAWNQDKRARYPQASPAVVAGIEALLLYAHQPTYNTAGKASVALGKGIRVFNTGRCGPLLPEVSFAYYRTD